MFYIAGDRAATTTAPGGNEDFPTVNDLPPSGEKIYAFLVSNAQLAAYGPGYQAVGYGAVGADGNMTMRGLPGKLKGQKVNAALTAMEAKQKFGSNAPWRQGDTTTVQPHTTGAPVEPPAH